MPLELLILSSHAMTPTQTAAVVDLCSEVFELDYSYYLNLAPDRIHVLGYDDGRLVSHALWLDRPLRVGDGPWRMCAYVEGVATHADYRRRGYGAAVMAALQAQIGGYAFGALSPAVEPWYVRLGWERWQGPLYIEKDGARESTPEETVLIYRTPLTGEIDLHAPLTGEWRPFEPW